MTVKDGSPDGVCPRKDSFFNFIASVDLQTQNRRGSEKLKQKQRHVLLCKICRFKIKHWLPFEGVFLGIKHSAEKALNPAFQAVEACFEALTHFLKADLPIAEKSRSRARFLRILKICASEYGVPASRDFSA